MLKKCSAILSSRSPRRSFQKLCYLPPKCQSTHERVGTLHLYYYTILRLFCQAFMPCFKRKSALNHTEQGILAASFQHIPHQCHTICFMRRFSGVCQVIPSAAVRNRKHDNTPRDPGDLTVLTPAHPLLQVPSTHRIRARHSRLYNRDYPDACTF